MLRSNTSLMMTLGLMTALSGAALAQDTPASPTTPDTQTNAQSGNAMPSGSAKLLQADKQFIAVAADANLTEIKTSELALKYATRQELKDFAQQMIDEHTKAQDELKQLGASKGATVPNQPNAMHQKAYARLSGLRGAAFDAAYVKIQKQGHAQTAQKFQAAMGKIQDADVKAYDAKYLPAVQQHLQMIKGMSPAGKMSHSGGKM